MRDLSPLRLKLLGKMVLFILGFLAIYFSTDYYSREKLKNSFCSSTKNKSHEILTPQFNADVIILGPSIVEMGINPKPLELIFPRIYNFAYPGSGARYYVEWYNRFFRPYYTKPKLVLYGIHPAFNEATSRKFEQDSAYLPTSVFFKALFDPHLSQRHLLFNRLYARLGFDDTQFSNPKIMRRYYKGYFPAPAADFGKASIQVGDAEQEFNSLHEVQKFLDVLKADGVKVILIGMPNYAAIPAEQSEMIERGFKAIEELARKREIPFLNYNAAADSLNSDTKYYADPLHLSVLGSQELSQRLLRDLARLIAPPAPLESAYVQGNYLFAREKFKEAIPFYEQAAQQNPDAAKAYLQLGKIYFQLHQYPKAIEMCMKGIALDSQMEEAYRVLSKIYYDTQDVDNAMQVNQVLFSFDPFNPDVLIETGILQQEKGKNSPAALKCFETAIHFTPTYAYAHYCLGALYQYSLNDPEQALSCYQKALRYNPSQIEAWGNSGVIYSQKGDTAQAIECFEKGYLLNDPMSARNLVVVYLQLKKYSEAQQVVKRMLQIRPGDPDFIRLQKLILAQNK